MRFSHFFIDRPIFAAVLSILITIIGLVSLRSLPLSEYPNIVPPTIAVTAVYPGANPETIAETVAAPLEQAINGVEDMLYISSQSTTDGRLLITVTFQLGTDLDDAQVLVQNRVATAEARLPEEVRRLGVTVSKQSPTLMMVVNLISPDESWSGLDISNYATLRIADQLNRLEGVGQAQVFGGSPYAMRIWLDPQQMAVRNIAAGDVLGALRRQNVQIASGSVGGQPSAGEAFELTVEAPGRLVQQSAFEEVVVATTPDGGLVRLKDIARVEIGAEDYSNSVFVNNQTSVAIGIFQRPGSNALETGESVIATMERLKQDFPPGIDYKVVYNPTEFVGVTIDKVRETMIEAILLVVLVVFLFLQTFRAALIPILAIPVSILGAFALIAGLGGSINTISMFGLILAIGIVVDDAIVVVENVERNLAAGMNPREAARKSMDEVGGALIAIGLVLIAVFLPVAFIGGIAGEFYRQFALTIATATAISAFVSLTLSPALAAAFLRPHDPEARHSGVLSGFFRWFNHGFDALGRRYGQLTRRAVRMSALVLVLYFVLIGATGAGFFAAPKGFIPAMDRGYAFAAIQLPPGASLERTREVVRTVSERVRKIDGVTGDVAFAGFNFAAGGVNAPNAATIFFNLEDFKTRDRGAEDIANEMRAVTADIKEAFILIITPPAVEGIGSGSGVKMMIQDRGAQGYAALDEAVKGLMFAANSSGIGVGQAFTLYEAQTPRVKLEVDRDQAEALNVPVANVNEALEVFLGSAYVNDFNFLGRTYRVTAQADEEFRNEESDIGRLWARSLDGQMVPLSALTRTSQTSGPQRVPRYNLYPAAELNAEPMPGVSSGQLIAALENLARNGLPPQPAPPWAPPGTPDFPGYAGLPPGFDFEWTELAFIEQQESGGALGVFLLAALFVFLVLAAQYESLTLPLAVVLVVPMAILGALVGVVLRGLDVNILTQVAFVVLIGLAAKNSILIVEFAKQLEDQEGLDRFEAAAKAAGLRLRPILMTSLAFILGVVPLVIATGAGAEQRVAIGTAVFSGMIGVTFIGLIMTPVFYVLARGLADRLPKRKHQAPALETPAE